MPKKRISGEVWGLIALFVLFVGFVAYSASIGQEKAARELPSTFSAQPQGVKALYLLLDHYGYPLVQLRTSWDALTSEDHLLIVVEPLDADRPITKNEIAALHDWVAQGGTILWFVTSPPRPLEPEDTVFGDVAITEAMARRTEIAPATPTSPYLRDVSRIVVNSPVRLLPAPDAHYETLLRDSQGFVALHKPLGKGHCLVVANNSSIDNAGIKDADNAVFLLNVADSAMRGTPGRILFDEYHHGVGFDSRDPTRDDTQFGSLPVPIRLAVWQLLGLGALLVYNGNRRFGRPRMLPVMNYRPSTDYIGSMARLFRRAGAADIALQTLHKTFVRDLTHALDMPPDARRDLLVERAQSRYGVDGAALSRLLARCEEVQAGQRIGEMEMLGLAQQLEQFRRRCNLVGT
jgi:hypothetical protein